MIKKFDGKWLAAYDSLCRSLLQTVPDGKPGDVHDTVIGFLEFRLLCAALDECDGNRVAASRRLGIHRNTLRRKINHYREVFAE